MLKSILIDKSVSAKALFCGTENLKQSFNLYCRFSHYLALGKAFADCVPMIKRPFYVPADYSNLKIKDKLLLLSKELILEMYIFG